MLISCKFHLMRRHSLFFFLSFLCRYLKLHYFAIIFLNDNLQNAYLIFQIFLHSLFLIHNFVNLKISFFVLFFIIDSFFFIIKGNRFLLSIILISLNYYLIVFEIELNFQYFLVFLLHFYYKISIHFTTLTIFLHQDYPSHLKLLTKELIYC